MIKVTEQKHNTIYYVCDCGAQGMCSFKPMDRDAAIVIDVICPACKESERITLLQYSSDDAKEDILNNPDNIDLSWVPTFNEEI